MTERKDFYLLEMEEERTARDKLHSQIQFVVGLEGKLQTTQEGMIDFLKDLPLVDGVFDLIPRNDRRLLQNLQRVDASVVLVPHQKHLPKRPSPNHTQQLEVVLCRNGGRRHRRRGFVSHVSVNRTILLVLEIAGTTHAIRRLVPVEHHLVLGTHGTHHATARPTVVLADEEGERNQANLALVDLPRRRLARLPWRLEPSWNTPGASSPKPRAPTTPRPSSSARGMCRRSVAAAPR